MYRSAEDERELADWLRWLMNASVSLVRMQYELDALLEASASASRAAQSSRADESSSTSTSTAQAQNCAGELVLLVAAHLHNNQLREVAQIVATRLNLKVLSASTALTFTDMINK